MTLSLTAPKRFAIAVSFPGEHRRFVRNVVNQLSKQLGRDRVFYDEWYEAELVGPDGDLKLRRYYREQCEMVVPFFSKHYAKPWCRIEWHAIRAMLLKRRAEGAVVPVELDETPIDGWEPVDFAIRRGGRTATQIAEQILAAYRHRHPQNLSSGPEAQRQTASDDRSGGRPGAEEQKQEALQRREQVEARHAASTVKTMDDTTMDILQTDFIGRQYELTAFLSLLPPECTDQTKVLVIHGITGIGKSTLLKQYHVLAAREGVPVARIDPRDHPTIFGFLKGIYQALNSRLPFPDLEKGLAHYERIREKLRRQRDIPKRVLLELDRGAWARATTLMPGEAMLNEAISAQEMDALVNKIYDVLDSHDADFWMEPAHALTTYAIADLNQYCNKNRLVIMVDPYHSIGHLDQWLWQVFAGLGQHSLLVIAADKELDAINQSFLPLITQLELEPFTSDESYLYLRKKRFSDEQLIAKIEESSGGWPLALYLLSRSVDQRLDDHGFSQQRCKITSRLVERFTRDVGERMNEGLRVCAIMRVVNEDSLRFMLGVRDAAQLFNELRTLEIMKVCKGGIRLHDAVGHTCNEELRWRSPERYAALNTKAANYYEQLLQQPHIEELERTILERLYHRIHASEIEGIMLFQEEAEKLARHRMVSRLADLLNDVNSYSLALTNSRLWLTYYNVRLFHLRGQEDNAEAVYKVIGEEDEAEPKLRAYALSDLGEMLARHQRLGQPQGAEKASRVLSRSLEFGIMDLHLVNAYISRARVAGFNGDLSKHREFIEKAKGFFEERQDPYGVVSTFFEMKRVSGHCGAWKEFLQAHERGLEALREVPTHVPALETQLSGWWAYTWALMGRYSFSESIARESLTRARKQKDEIACLYILRDLGWALGMQAKFDGAYACFSESKDIAEQHGMSQRRQQGLTLEFWGAVLARQGELEQGMRYSAHGLEIHESLGDKPGLLEPLNALGTISEVQGNLEEAATYYDRHRECNQYGRQYLRCQALTGLVRVKHARKDYASIVSLLAEAEQLAQQHEYNDHLASLRLTQGHVSWYGHVAEWGRGLDVTLSFYQQALVYALRYNRFLLDEVLWGGKCKTPLRPIVPSCRKRGDEGRWMLVRLRDWWRKGMNDVGISRADTVSLIPEGIALLKADHIGRELEPGDGNKQQSVEETLSSAGR